MRSVKEYRERQVISWPRAVAVSAPVAGAVALGEAVDPGPWWFLVLGAVLVVTLVSLGPRVRTGIQVLEAREGDYPGYTAALPLVGWGASMLASLPVFDALDWHTFASPMGQWVAAAGLVGGLTVFGAWNIRKLEAREHRVGLRRARKILAAPDISKVTVDRLDALDRHADLIAAMLAVGAVDGVQVRAWKLAELTGRPLEEVIAAARELAGHGLLHVANIGLDSATRHWWLSVTETGVRVGAELSRR